MSYHDQKHIDTAVRLLNAEFERLHLLPLATDQVEALRDPEQVYDMLDDFEARMGADVADARAELVEYHLTPEEAADCEADGDVGGAA